MQLNSDGRSTKQLNLIARYHELVLRGDDSDAIEDVEKILTDKKTKNIKDKPDHMGETALMKAARLGYLTMLTMLLEYNCDIDLRDQVSMKLNV